MYLFVNILFPSGGDCASIDVVPKKPKRKRNVFLKFTKVLQNIRRPRRSGYQLLAEGGENPLRSKKETSKYGKFYIRSLIID